VTVDGVLVKCHVTRAPRSDVNRLVGHLEPGAAFRIIVPGWVVRPGVRLRLFAVSEIDPTLITELRVPQ
jgi:hypothetical protein